MKQIAFLNRDKHTRFAFIDFFNIRTEEDFLERYSSEIINLPEKIAAKKRIKIVVCIDEFQGISKLKEHIALEQNFVLTGNTMKMQHTD